MTKGWKLESARHSLARKGIETGRKNKKIINHKIFVGDLGEAIISKDPKAITAYYIREEDGTKSWQLLPDENRGDTILKTTKVIPVEPIESPEKELQPFALKHENVEEGKGETYQYDVLGQFYPQGEKVGKLYQRYYKGRKAEIVWMTPDEYFEKVNRGLKEKGYEHDIREGLEGEGIKKYADAMKKGDKFAMPWLEYQKGKYAGHEGKHRVAAAKSLGIEKIPVVIANQITEGEDHRRWMKAKEKYGIKD